MIVGARLPTFQVLPATWVMIVEVVPPSGAGYCSRRLTLIVWAACRARGSARRGPSRRPRSE